LRQRSLRELQIQDLSGNPRLFPEKASPEIISAHPYGLFAKLRRVVSAGRN
jgi:hypothetical protein